LKALKNPALLLENEQLNLVELTKYTPRYLADSTHLIESPDATILQQVFLCLVFSDISFMAILAGGHPSESFKGTPLSLAKI